MLVSFTCLWAQSVTDVITLQSFRDAGYMEKARVFDPFGHA